MIPSADLRERTKNSKLAAATSNTIPTTIQIVISPIRATGYHYGVSEARGGFPKTSLTLVTSSGAWGWYGRMDSPVRTMPPRRTCARKPAR